MPKSPSATAPHRQRRKESRPQELLDAALDLFVEKGFAATRSEEVAVRAGVSKGTLYLYYPSKEELLKEVIRHNMVNQIAEGVTIVSEFEGSTSELFARVFGLWWERIGETRASGIMKLMMSEVRNFPEIAQFYADEVIRPAEHMVSQMVQRGIDRQEFRQVDVPEVVHALMAPMLFLVMHKHSIGACGVGHSIEPRRFIATHVDLVLHGLARREPAAASARPAGETPSASKAPRKNDKNRKTSP
jgi:TetR/AcrR family transcriptional regulator